MKKLISLFLSVCMVFTVLVGSVAAAPDILFRSDNSVSEDLLKASGKTYGPWFGSSTYPYNNDVTVGMRVMSIVIAALVPFVPDPVAQSVASAVSAGLGVITFPQDNVVYGRVTKKYRQVFINGDFAYFQNHYTITAYTDAGKVPGSPFVEIHESMSVMSIDN